jgi:hypothetical protein
MGFAVRLVALSLTISASAPLYAQNPTARPTELLLAELAAALESGNPDDFLRTRAWSHRRRTGLNRPSRSSTGDTWMA